jgi:predicted CoA-binding protein
VIPVNPNADEVFGRRAYDSLSAVDREVELVDVFRPSEELSGIVEEAADRGDVKAIWAQLDIEDDDAAGRAERAGLQIVQDRCIKVEHQRLVG